MQRLSIGPLYHEFSRKKPTATDHRVGRDDLSRDRGRAFGTDPNRPGPARQIDCSLQQSTDRSDPNQRRRAGRCACRHHWGNPALDRTMRHLHGQPKNNYANGSALDVPHGAHVCPIADDLIHWSDEIAIPYAPMLGCIGTAPDWGSPTTGPAGPHGGNLDLIEVCPGNTVFLPVFVEGALLYVGDAHAAMGHGELSADRIGDAGGVSAHR